MVLKMISSGYLSLNTHALEEISSIRKCHRKTIKKHLEDLVQQGWISIHNEIIYIRSFQYISKKQYKADRVLLEFLPCYLNTTRAYLIGGFIGMLTYAQKGKKFSKTKRGEGACKSHNKGTSSYQHKHPPCYYPIANLVISKVLHIDISTASKYKAEALKEGFIDIHKSFKMENLNVDQVNLQRTVNSDFQEIYRVRKGEVQSVGIDHVKCRLKFKRKKNHRYRRDNIQRYKPLHI